MTSMFTIDQARETARDLTGENDLLWVCGKEQLAAADIDWAVAPESAEQMLAALQAVIKARAGQRPAPDQHGILVLIEETDAVLTPGTAAAWAQIVRDGKSAGVAVLAPTTADPGSDDDEVDDDGGIAALRQALNDTAAEIIHAEAPALPLPEVFQDFLSGQPVFIAGHGPGKQAPRYAKARPETRLGCCKHAASTLLAFGRSRPGQAVTVDQVIGQATVLYPGFIPTHAEATQALNWATSSVAALTGTAEDIDDTDLA